MKREKRNTKKYAGILLIILAIVSLCYAGWHICQKKVNGDIYTKVQKEVEADKKKAKKQEEEKPAKKDSADGKETYVSPIDFKHLQETNPDIYAWIEIPDTKINYPVVQREGDDTYYLNHTIAGAKGYPGAIYTESLNAKDFSDFNTVIYGHNMNNGSMFKGLHKYEDILYLQEHPYVYIYTPSQKITYRIFAAVVYSNVHILNSYDFTDAYQRQLYLESVLGSRDMKNSVDESVQVGTQSRILTLSTCIGRQASKRYIVEAVRIDE